MRIISTLHAIRYGDAELGDLHRSSGKLLSGSWLSLPLIGCPVNRSMLQGAYLAGRDVNNRSIFLLPTPNVQTSMSIVNLVSETLLFSV